MKLPHFPVEGGCQCGAVRYRITAPPLAVYNCHCEDCRRFSGATHSMSMPTQKAAFEHLRGEVTAYNKPADSGRTVPMMGCVVCGTKVWNEPQATPDVVIIKAGTLDDMSWAVPVGNIWTDSKVPWVEIDESQVNFPGQPTDRQPLYDAWARAISAG